MENKNEKFTAYLQKSNIKALELWAKETGKEESLILNRMIENECPPDILETARIITENNNQCEIPPFNEIKWKMERLGYEWDEKRKQFINKNKQSISENNLGTITKRNQIQIPINFTNEEMQVIGIWAELKKNRLI